jgi:hypothetical protein
MTIYQATVAARSIAQPGLILLSLSMALEAYLKWRSRKSAGLEWREINNRMAVIENELTTPKAVDRD